MVFFFSSGSCEYVLANSESLKTFSVCLGVTVIDVAKVLPHAVSENKKLKVSNPTSYFLAKENRSTPSREIRELKWGGQLPLNLFAER